MLMKNMLLIFISSFLNKIDYEFYLFFKNVNYHDLKQLDYK